MTPHIRILVLVALLVALLAGPGPARAGAETAGSVAGSPASAPAAADATRAGDPKVVTLAQAVAIARERAASTRLAALDEERAAANAREERGTLLPHVTGTASQASRSINLKAMGIEIPGQESLIGPFGTFDARVSLTQTVFDRTGWMNWRAAGTEHESAAADRTHAQEEAATTAANASLMLARASATIEARQADLTLAEELLALAVTRRDAGTSPEIDVTRASAQVAMARGSLVSAQHDERLARIDLCRALDLAPGTALDLAAPLDTAFARIDDPGSIDAAVGHAYDRRSDLAALRGHSRSARQRLAAARGEYIPKLEVVADIGGSGEDPGDAEETHNLALQMRWPLVDGGAREARIDERRAAADAADVAAKDAEAAIDAEVRDAWSAIDAGRTLEAVALERERLAQDEVAQARLKLQEGMGGNLDLIEAQSQLVRARAAVIDARSRSALARIALARAMGMATDLH